MRCAANGCKENPALLVTEVLARRYVAEYDYCEPHGRAFIARHQANGHVGVGVYGMTSGATCFDIELIVFKYNAELHEVHLREIGKRRVFVLSIGYSCVAAVARVMVLRIALGLPPCSANTGAYCKARAKLPEDFLRGLTYLVGDAVEDQAPDGWRWRGRRVLLADGCEVTAADTPANQKEYPQPGSQKPGLGFPRIRLVVLLTFATASLVGAACGPHQGQETGETALFRALLDRLRPGDVVVADRYYCSYWMVALLWQRGVDVVFRLHQRRDYDFRRGRRLGRGDHVVAWAKPQRPDWMDQET